MSEEVFQILMQLDKKSVETQLAIQCAPLLAGIKISNLLTISCAEAESIEQVLNQTDIAVCPLYQTGERTTFLLYHPERMQCHLTAPATSKCMNGFGYCSMEIHHTIEQFRANYDRYLSDKKSFPHEMGILLGYPVEDVLGFMHHQGENYLYCGYWKVYGRLDDKLRMFQAYEDAREIIMEALSKGNNIAQVVDTLKESRYSLQAAI